MKIYRLKTGALRPRFKAVSRIGCGLLTVLLLSATASLFADPYFPPSDLAGGWRKSTDPGFIRSLGLDPVRLQEFGAYNLSIPSEEIQSALVIKDGWLVGEWYSRYDGATFTIYLASVGKTVATVCFGIAVKDALEGRIPHRLDRHAPVYDRAWLQAGFPLSDPRKKSITFDHIFRHTSGLMPQQTGDGAVVEMGRNDWTDYVSWVVGRDRRWPQTGMLYFPPGEPEAYTGREQWGVHQGAYSSLAFAHIGLVIKELYAMPAHQFLWTRLLNPLGFTGVDYHDPPDPPEIKWFSAGGLMMTPRDFARFSYFLLHQGVWEGKELLEEHWINAFTSTPYYENLRSNVDSFFGQQYPPDMFRLFGSGGNMAFVIPSHNLIVLRTGRVDNFFTEVLQRDFLRRAFRMIPGHATD